MDIDRHTSRRVLTLLILATKIANPWWLAAAWAGIIILFAALPVSFAVYDYFDGSNSNYDLDILRVNLATSAPDDEIRQLA